MSSAGALISSWARPQTNPLPVHVALGVELCGCSPWLLTRWGSALGAALMDAWLLLEPQILPNAPVSGLQGWQWQGPPVQWLADTAGPFPSLASRLWPWLSALVTCQESKEWGPQPGTAKK